MDIHYDMNGVLLNRVRSVKDLGILVTDDLHWAQHISEITLKANRTLGLVKRVCNQVKYKRMLENIQCGATKFTLDYPLHCSYTERLVKLNLLPLEHRRIWNDLVFFFKCQHALYDLDISNIAIPRTVRHNIRSCNLNNSMRLDAIL